MILGKTTSEGNTGISEVALFPLRLFPPAAYYALMSRHSKVAFDTDALYVKADKGTHRFDIADTRGKITLTVPVSKPSGAKLWKETIVSSHGRWWETMPVALESAYGRTPFFEFYIDRFMPLFAYSNITVDTLCLKADNIVRGILHTLSTIVDKPQNNFISYSDTDVNNLSLSMPRHWQIREDKLGFIPGLSILDLIFNLGPEAELYLEKLC